MGLTGDTRPPGPPNTTLLEKDQSTGEQEEEEEEEEEEEHDFSRARPNSTPRDAISRSEETPLTLMYIYIQQIYSSPRTLGFTGDTRPPGPPNTT